MSLVLSNTQDTGITTIDGIIRSHPPWSSFILIVPTKRRVRDLQQEFIKLSPNSVSPSLNLFTLSSFVRCIYDASCPGKHVVQGPVQAVIIEEAIRRKREQLGYFFPRGNDRLPRGTFQKIIETINNMKEHGLYADQLTQELSFAEVDESVKIKDMALIYQEYESLLDEYKAIDVAGFYKALLEHPDKINVSDVFRKAFRDVKSFFVGGFGELAPPELTLLDKVADVDDLKMVIEFDYAENNPSLFGNLYDAVEQFRKRGLVAVAEYPQREANISERFRNHCARYLFARSRPSEKLDIESHVHLVAVKNSRAEVDTIARIIKRYLLKNPSVDPSTICVATYEIAGYTALFREVFKEYGIPVNITDRFQLANSPVIISILAFLDAAKNNFRRKDILRALGNPYCILTRPSTASESAGQESSRLQIDAANLHTVARRLKITAGREAWHKHIKLRQDIARQQLEEAEDEIEREELNQELASLKRADSDLKIVEDLLIPFCAPMTPGEFRSKLLTFINAIELPNMMMNGDGGILTNDERELETRAYRKFLKLIDDILELLDFQKKKKEKYPLEFYLEQLKTAVGQVRYNVRQRHGAGVYVTTIEETRGLKFEIMLLAGLTDGKFPEVYKPEIFLSNQRRPTEERHLREQRYFFFQGITNYSKELYLFYPEMDGETELVRSVFIDALIKIATVHSWTEDDFRELAEPVYSPTDLFERFGKLVALEIIEEGNKIKAGASPLLQPVLHHIERGIEIEQSRMKEHSLPDYEGEIGKALSEKEKTQLEKWRSRTYSISQLEMFGKCPFQFFANRVLKLELVKEVEEELTPLEKGNLLHEILFEFYIKRREAGKPTLFGCNDEEYREALNDILTLASKNISSQIVSDIFWDFDKEAIVGFENQRKGILKELIEFERKNEFLTTPKYFEASFGGKTGIRRKSDPLFDQTKPLQVGSVRMRGKIDRIEIGPNEFAIVDYKTGKTLATRKDIEDGISLQLPVYLYVIELFLKEMTGIERTPAAGIYYQLRTPVKRTIGIGSKEYNKKVFNTTPSSGQMVESTQELKNIISKSIDLVNSYVGDIVAGKFRLTTPNKIDRVCGYCDYKKICRIQTVRQVAEHESGE